MPTLKAQKNILKDHLIQKKLKFKTTNMKDKKWELIAKAHQEYPKPKTKL